MDEKPVFGNPEPEAGPLNHTHDGGQQENRRKHEEQDAKAARIVPQQGRERDQGDQRSLNQDSRRGPDDVSGEEWNGEG